jgi:predicted lipopolysaccharide heptosyltransferase III
VAPIPAQDIRRILITRLRFLGDVVLSTPLIRAVRQALPLAHIAYLAEKPYGEVLEGNPNVDEVISLERKEIASLPLTRRASAHAGFIRSLRGKDFDLVIDLLGNPRSGLLSFLTGARYRLGPARRGRAAYYTHLVPEPESLHTQIETQLAFLRPLGADPAKAGQNTAVFLSDEEREEARSYLTDNHLASRPLVIIHPGASWPAKRWHLDRFARTAERLMSELKATIILLGGPEEQAIIREVAKNMKFTPHMAEGLSIRRLCALLDTCDLFITNDAGPMHIACALGRPCLALFGPGDPGTWFPYHAEDGQVAIHHPPPCWPCSLDECEKLDCMKAITTDEVVKKAKQLLSLHPAPYPRHPGVLCPT